MPHFPHILLIDDDEDLSLLIKSYLSEYSFNVDILTSGEYAVEYITSNDPSLIILELMLPHQDGLSICQEIRKQYQGIILMLTASSDDMDHVAALEIGVDDFLQKPVHPRVLLAKIKNLLRRKDYASQQSKQMNEIQLGNLWLNNLLKRCKLNHEVIPLTPTEFALLWDLAKHAEQVRSREHLLKSIRNLDYDGLDRSIDNKISQIRKKIKDNSSHPQSIITVRGKGYMLLTEPW